MSWEWCQIICQHHSEEGRETIGNDFWMFWTFTPSAWLLLVLEFYACGDYLGTGSWVSKNALEPAGH